MTPAVSASAAQSTSNTYGVYVVLMASDPVVTYDGAVAGLASTRPDSGFRIDSRSPQVVDYQAHLRAEHAAVLGAAGVEPRALLYDYTLSVNGFAAAMSAADAAAVARQAGVIAVSRDEIRHIETDSSPDFLGLTDPRGPWATGYTGEDVVVGIIDTGIWPEHPSFSDDGSYGIPPDHFTGTSCEFGAAVDGAPAFNARDEDFDCNGKVVAAAAFGVGLAAGSSTGPNTGEYLSARDADGHGTHVAGTAAGNRDVPALIGSVEWSAISGVAPRARVAAYKACWSMGAAHGECAVSDIVAAVDQAVADGVDVLNLSVGGSSATFAADDLALLNAGAAGVMVAAAAGNEGPGRATVGSPAGTPWVAAVAAATQLREFGALLTLGDGTVVEGVSAGAATGSLPLLDSAALGNPSCDPAAGFTESIAGAAVLCHDAEAAFSAASAVAAAGGAGVIHVAAGELPTASNDQSVPAITVDGTAGTAIGSYADAAGSEATASFGPVSAATGAGSVVAPFSSRGPSALAAELLKPDVAAPGVSILAATSPTSLTGVHGELFAVKNGTSLASAHVAGVFALLRQAHPAWTGELAKSALVTTTRRDVWKPDGSTPATGLDMGAGYIQPGGAVNQRGSIFNPGLVFVSNMSDYVSFLCGLATGGGEQAVSCEDEPLAARDLNTPSIVLDDVAGSVTVSRTVTSVADKLRVFDGRVAAPPGYAAEITPRTISLAPGESATFEVTITRTRAPVGELREGSITWASDSYRVTMPIVVRGAALHTDRTVRATEAEGRADISVEFGYTGQYAVAATALATPSLIEGSVEADPGLDFAAASASGTGISTHSIDIGEGTALLRVSMAAGDVSSDLDLYIVGPDDVVVASATAPGSAEVVDVLTPAAGTYRLVVHGLETGADAAAYTLSLWDVIGTADGALEVTGAPESAELGSAGLVTIRWPALDPNLTYVGVVSHSNEAKVLDHTVVVVGPSTSE